MARLCSLLGLLCVLVSGTAAQSQPDPLQIFDGPWVFVTAPIGVHVTFSKVGGGKREASLPFGQAILSVSDGTGGSNYKLSGPNFDCYYWVGKIDSRDMTWELKEGPGQCLQSMRMKKDPP